MQNVYKTLYPTANDSFVCFFILHFEGHLDMVRFLLEAGADQEHKTDEMHTALMEACMVNLQ